MLMAIEHMDSVKIKACGKVNLGLDVVGQRPDGYHLVRMVMQTVDLYDDITVTARPSSDASGSDPMSFFITLSCDTPGVPTDEENLAYRAARMIAEKYSLRGQMQIDMIKRIPMAAGMAGGSADGAAVIEAMDQVYALHMSPEEKDEIALRLGADVPFCLRKGTYLAEGIGEELTKIADLRSLEMVIIKPDFGISTKWAYEALDLLMERSEVDHPDIDALVEAVNDRDIDKMAKKMENALFSKSG